MLERAPTLPRNLPKIRCDLVWSYASSPEEAQAGIEAWRRATEILLRASARIEEAEAAARSISEQLAHSPRPSLDCNIDIILCDFIKVAHLAGVDLSIEDIEVEVLPAPHIRPKRLPIGKRSVYMFCTLWDCLKVARVESKSQPRFTNQPYSLTGTKSTLAGAITRCDAEKTAYICGGILSVPTKQMVGEWIMQNTTRYHFYLDASQPDHIAALLESFLKCRLTPLFGDD